MKKCAVMLWLIFAAAACGQQEQVSFTSASLIVPRQLAEQIKRIEVYCFETAANRPRCDELLNTGTFESYRRQAFSMLGLNFPGQNTTVFDKIPDRGTVWRFYARGYDVGNNLIAQGCNSGLFEIKPGRDTQIEIMLTAY